MTVVENLTPRVQYNYIAEQQQYPITFPYIERQYVKCMVGDELLVYNTDYQIPAFDQESLDDNELYLTLLVTPTAGDIITIYRETPIDQQTEFPQEARFSSQKITEALDKLTQLSQEQADDITQCLRLAKNLPESFNTMLPFPEANQVIQWNSDGTQLINYDLRGEIAEFEADVNDAIDDFKTDINDAIDDFKTDVNDEIDTFKTEVAENISEISTEVGTANTTAQAAESKADTAVGTANSASSTADEAKTIASTASTNASTALSTANTASTNASTAISTANTAKSTADATSAKVDEFEEDIEVVIEAAESIGDLDEKITTATEAATTASTAATNATNAASSATTAAQNATNAATSATTAAQTATTKAQEAAQSAATFKQSDWNQTVSTESDYIKNKPTVVKSVNNTQPDANGNVTIQTSSLPSQTGQSGKFLTTDGTNPSWSNVDGLPSQTGQSGKYLTTNGTNVSWSEVNSLPSQTGQSGKFLTTNGTDASWSNVDTLPSQTGHSGDLLTTDGTDASWADTTEVYPVITPYINGGSWYRISAPDNTGYRWCEMGGLYYLGSTMAATDITITFLKTFKDLKYTFVAFAIHSDAALSMYQMFEKYTLRTKTSTVLRITSAQFGYEWIAKGYIENES